MNVVEARSVLRPLDDIDAEIVADPAATDVANPPEAMVATDVLLEDQVTVAVTSPVVPLL